MKNTVAILLLVVLSLYAAGISPALIPALVPAANKSGNSSKFQLESGTATSGAFVEFDSNGNTITAVSPSLSSLTFTSVNAHQYYVLGNSQQIFSFADSSACNVGGGSVGSFGVNVGTGCPNGIVDLEGGPAGNATQSPSGMRIAAATDPQNGNNSSVTGGTGGGITLLAGAGGGFSGGSSSTGGLGGGISITAGNGGQGNSSGTNGNGGAVTLTPGAAGSGGAGTGGAAGSIVLAGQSSFTGKAPAVSSCGSGAALVSGATDNRGTINVGSGVTTACTLTFARTFTNTPACTVADNTTAVTPDISSISTTAVTFGFSASIASGQVYYICF